MINFRKTVFVTSYGFAEQLSDSSEKEIVFCGRSNVGKSSLINKLCGQNKLARVSSSPGKTTTINFYRTTDDLFLVDLPGYGYAKRAKSDYMRWAGLMEHYFSSGRNIRHALILLDSRHAPNDDDLQMIDYVNRYDIPYWAIITKTDKLNKTEYAAQVSLFEELLDPLGCSKIVPFSIKNERDAEELRNMLSNLLES